MPPPSLGLKEPGPWQGPCRGLAVPAEALTAGSVPLPYLSGLGSRSFCGGGAREALWEEKGEKGGGVRPRGKRCWVEAEREGGGCPGGAGVTSGISARRMLVTLTGGLGTGSDLILPRCPLF